MRPISRANQPSEEHERKWTYNEGVSYRRQNGIFVHNVVDLLQTNDFSFLENLNRIELVGLFIPGKPDSAERTLDVSHTYLSQGFALCHSHPD